MRNVFSSEHNMIPNCQKLKRASTKNRLKLIGGGNFIYSPDEILEFLHNFAHW